MERSLPDYQVSGSSDNTVFLLHGLYGAKDYWRFVTRRLLDEGYRVVAWDTPGYGLSRQPENFSLMGAARSFVDLLTETGSRTNIVLGHSMGGQIAMRATAMVPELVSGVVISATIGYFGNRSPEEQAEFINKRQSKSTGAPDPAQFATVIQGMMGEEAAGEEVDLVRTVGSTSPPAAMSAALEAVKSAPDDDAISSLKSLTMPTLFVAGSVDQTGKVDGMERLSRMVAGSTLAVVEGSGHYPWAEKPDDFWSHFNPFLRKCVDGRST